MLWFPPDFFQSEYREEFLVDSTMKTVWAAELEVLAAIAAVCEKYQLRWFADWGTLLGAVRHEGFVPWDDDMDICMLREDYEKLMKVLPGELPESWEVHHGSLNSQDQFWACVMNGSTISIEEKRLTEFHGCPFIVGVDIFPLDYLPRDEEERQMEVTLFTLIWKLVRIYKDKERTPEDEEELQEGLDAIEDYLLAKIDRSGDIVTQLWNLANNLCKSFTEKEGDELVDFMTYVKNNERIYKKEWFESEEYLPFESVEIAVPVGYHEVLSVEYGNYMERVRNQASHDYPFYNKQLEQLREMVKKMEEAANA